MAAGPRGRKECWPPDHRCRDPSSSSALCLISGAMIFTVMVTVIEIQSLMAWPVKSTSKVHVPPAASLWAFLSMNCFFKGQLPTSTSEHQSHPSPASPLPGNHSGLPPEGDQAISASKQKPPGACSSYLPYCLSAPVGGQPVGCVAGFSGQLEETQELSCSPWAAVLWRPTQGGHGRCPCSMELAPQPPPPF